MPITPEQLAERTAAAAAVNAAEEALQTAKARLDAAHTAMGDAMSPGEIFCLAPLDVPAIRKDAQGNVSVGMIHSAHPNANPVAAQ